MQCASCIPPRRRRRRRRRAPPLCWLTMCMLQWFRSRRFPLRKREVGCHCAGETGERRKGGFVVVSCMRSHAKAERSQQTRRPRSGERRRNRFFSRVYIYAYRGIAARLFIDHGRRESDDNERSPRGSVLEALFTRDVQTRVVVASRRKGNLDSRSWKITARFALNVFWRVSLRRIRTRHRNDSFYGSTDDNTVSRIQCLRRARSGKVIATMPP